MQWTYIIAALVIAGVIIAALQFLPDDGDASGQVEQRDVPPEIAPDVRLAGPPPGNQPEIDIVIPLPNLQESDPFLRRQVADLNPPEKWLEQEDLIGLFVVILENAQTGDYPRRYLDFLAPVGSMQVQRLPDERILLDPKSFRRFDPLVAGLESIPPQRFVDLVRLTRPLIEEAYLGLGEGAVDPINRLRTAAEIVISTPELNEDIELVQPHVVFKYADPDLEARPPLVKQLLRMGPANVKRVKAYAQAVLDLLNSE